MRAAKRRRWWGRRNRGIHLPKAQVPAVVEMFEDYRGRLEELFVPAVDRVGDGADDFLVQVRAAVETGIDPQFGRLMAELGDDYLEAAPEQVGLGTVPGGRELYVHRVRMHTTTDLTPEEIHQLGLDEVARIEVELAALREENAYDLYGRLVMEMFISCRLVLDTGMNYFGWDLERAREYMSTRVVYSDVEVATELLRYSADIHGQTLAYRTGNLEILRQRRKAEEALGDRFDIKAFHAAVIGSGAMPMVVLDEHIDWWIGEQG